VIAGAPPALRTVTFGDLQTSQWGVIVADQQTCVLLGADARADTAAQLSLERPGDGGDWRIAGAEVELVVSGVGEPASVANPDGFDQLCRVRGRQALDGVQRDVDCPGIRGARDEGAIRQFASVRGVSAWFEPGEGVAVLALRPAKAPGHSADAVTGTVFDPEGPLRVAEPRLSTTYGAGELPVRMGLELWIGEDESEQYSRRFAGEAAGPRTRSAQNGRELEATLLRCHSRGRDGTGVYLLARLR